MVEVPDCDKALLIWIITIIIQHQAHPDVITKPTPVTPMMRMCLPIILVVLQPSSQYLWPLNSTVFQTLTKENT